MEGPKGKVLVVDDLEINRSALARLLRREGYEAECVEDGASALARLEQEPFDLVLLDVMMPGMSGFEVLEAIKRHVDLRHLPVIMISALNEPESTARCIEAGADDFLLKPFNSSLLKARLRSSLAQKQLRDQERNHIKALEAFSAELIASNDELKRLYQLKSRFMAIAAHDLKNPLTALMLTTEMAQERGMTPAETQKVHTAVDRMLGIITGLLQGEATSMGLPAISKRPTDLLALTRAVVEDNEGYARSKDISLRLEAGSESFLAEVDEGRIGRAIDNLVNNAVKYSPLGSEVHILLRRDGPEGHERIRILVRDQGPGLTDADKALAFGFSQKLSAKPTGSESSSGVGLFLVKQMVELHEGKVSIESSPGAGSCFTIELQALQLV